MGFVIYFSVLAAIAVIGILLYNYNKKSIVFAYRL